MIFYLSCTGNTRWAAEMLSEATGERLVSIPEVMAQHEPYELSEDERIGFCFPVHGWRPPKMIREWMEDLRFAHAEGHYVWALCTAGDTVGEAMDIFCDDLSRIGLHADSTYSLLMPESYVGLPFMDVDSKENETRKLQSSAELLNEYARQITNRQGGEHRIVRGRWPRINSRVIGSVFVKHLVNDRPFHVEADRCIHCGKCVSVCPARNMRMSADGVPEWMHNGECLTCFACYHHCPRHAIEYGNRTKKKGQYYRGDSFGARGKGQEICHEHSTLNTQH